MAAISFSYRDIVVHIDLSTKDFTIFIDDFQYDGKYKVFDEGKKSGKFQASIIHDNVNEEHAERICPVLLPAIYVSETGAEIIPYGPHDGYIVVGNQSDSNPSHNTN